MAVRRPKRKYCAAFFDTHERAKKAAAARWKGHKKKAKKTREELRLIRQAAVNKRWKKTSPSTQ